MGKTQKANNLKCSLGVVIIILMVALLFSLGCFMIEGPERDCKDCQERMETTIEYIVKEECNKSIDAEVTLKLSDNRTIKGD